MKIPLDYLRNAIWLTFASFLLFSCSEEKASFYPYQTIKGRDGIATYRVKVPSDWEHVTLDREALAEDTTKPIAEFLFKDIKITIHNFPVDDVKKAILPQAQVQRWKKQFQNLDPVESSVTPCAWGGFRGLFFQGIGLTQDKHIAVFGWAMQIGQVHSQMLAHEKEKRADYTIKIVGPIGLMKELKETLVEFARSFELINEIPNRS